MTQIQENKLPEWWIEKTLGEVCENVISWWTPSTKRDDFYWWSIPWVRTQEVNFNYINDTEIKITELGLKNSSARWVPEDTVIIAMYWNSAWRVWYLNIKATTNQACCNLISDKNKSDSKFIFFNLLNRYSEIKWMANWAAQQNLNVWNLKNLKLSLPPLPEQQAIAKILSSFDDKIELLREQNETLEKIWQEIFKEWFGKYNVWDELPEGWRVGKLGEVLKFIKWKKPNDTSEIFIDWYIPQILIETFDSWKVTYANPKNTVLISENDLIMVMDWASSWRLEIWYSWIVWSTLSKIEVDEKLKMMIYAFLKSKFKEINNWTTGSSIPHTDKAKIFNFDFFVTDENYINDFNKLYWSFLYKVLDNKKQIQTLSKTRDELLPKLMKGEVRVV